MNNFGMKIVGNHCQRKDTHLEQWHRNFCMSYWNTIRDHELVVIMVYHSSEDTW